MVREKKTQTQNMTTQIVTKLKDSNCDKTQKLKLGQNMIYDKSQVD